MYVTDVMIDLETSSTSSSYGSIFQIGAVKFNLYTGEVGETFKISLKMPKTRFWDEGTRQFWASRIPLYNEIMSDATDSEAGFRKFIDWINESKNADIRAWSKPLSFDLPFIASYCDMYNIQIPFKHWQERDLRSFMLGVYGENMPKITMKEGLTEHDALADALNQTLWAIETWKYRKENMK